MGLGLLFFSSLACCCGGGATAAWFGLDWVRTALSHTLHSVPLPPLSDPSGQDAGVTRLPGA